MNNSLNSPASSLVEGERNEASETSDTAILKRNPKIDRRLLAEHERLATTSDVIVRSKKQGADYNIAHPLAREDMPTDAYHRGKRERVAAQT